MTWYLVTEGAGFIGSRLTRAIVERGGTVLSFLGAVSWGRVRATT
jgi:nucleoside-diphosphate-sugar epimerase